MCTNDINLGQLDSMIDQIDDHLALEYRCVHKLAHTVDNAGFVSTSEKLHTAQVLLADVRAMLDEAKQEIESESQASVQATTVQLV